MKILYQNKSPKFLITKDSYQWILCLKQSNRGDWTDKSYFPKLSLLLEELSEQFFRKDTKRIRELKDLDRSISKVYELIFNIGVALEKPRK